MAARVRKHPGVLQKFLQIEEENRHPTTADYKEMAETATLTSESIRALYSTFKKARSRIEVLAPANLVAANVEVHSEDDEPDSDVGDEIAALLPAQDDENGERVEAVPEDAGSGKEEDEAAPEETEGNDGEQDLESPKRVGFGKADEKPVMAEDVGGREHANVMLSPEDAGVGTDIGAPKVLDIEKTGEQPENVPSSEDSGMGGPLQDDAIIAINSASDAAHQDNGDKSQLAEEEELEDEEYIEDEDEEEEEEEEEFPSNGIVDVSRKYRGYSDGEIIVGNRRLYVSKQIISEKSFYFRERFAVDSTVVMEPHYKSDDLQDLLNLAFNRWKQPTENNLVKMFELSHLFNFYEVHGTMADVVDSRIACFEEPKLVNFIELVVQYNLPNWNRRIQEAFAENDEMGEKENIIALLAASKIAKDSQIHRDLLEDWTKQKKM